MSVEILTKSQTIRVRGVTDVVVTPTVADGETFVRAIRILDETGGVAFELQIEADEASKIALTTPRIDF